MSFEWTEERVETTRGMFADRLSASQIAQRLGVSRNAVCGKLARMGLTRAPDQYLSSANKKPRVPTGSLAFKVIHSIKRKQAEAGIEPRPFVCRDFSDIAPRHLDLLELEPNDCRYPSGDGPFVFCGHPRRKGTPYCPGHCAVAFNGIPPRSHEPKPYRMGGAA